ncbi:MAG: hypothetical protein B7Z12_09665 [Caulobacter vibrioides]|uniref:Uncharacterized protein n=1 Tax=Caulobacter vibrioides TaxID=155892 RepID=A0A258D787_CAUVI|nr:MAG: hypothetical protein B7Z12_09665 [Caulobacter vibrioides]
MNVGQSWFKTNEAEDVAGSVRHVLRCWPLIPDDPHVWKWIALALHSAIQGACVAHLVTTARPVGAVTDRNAKEWMEYFERSRTEDGLLPPRTYLMALPDLLKSARKPDSAGSGAASSPIRINDNELGGLEGFHNEVRNQFVHFEPMGWSIEVSGMAHLAALIGRLLSEIIDAGWAFRNETAAWRNELRNGAIALTKLGEV